MPEHLPEETRQRKVLTEKYRSDRLWMMDWIQEQKNKIVRNLWMMDWIQEQKNKIVRNQQYEEAAKWRDIERTFYNIEENEEKHHLRPQFDEIFFYLYESLE